MGFGSVRGAMGSIRTARMGTEDGGPGGGGFLDEIWQDGFDDDPELHNTMHGPLFEVYFNLDDDGIVFSEPNPSTGADPQLLIPFVRMTRHSEAPFGGQAYLMADYELLADGFDDDDYGGGSKFRHVVIPGDGSAKVIGQETIASRRPPQAPGYRPTYVDPSDQLLTENVWLMKSRRGSPDTQVLFNSDGGHFRMLLIPGEGPEGGYRYEATKLSMYTRSGDAPLPGSAVSYVVVGPTQDFDEGTEIARFDACLDDADFNSDDAEGHWEVWASAMADGPNLIAEFRADTARIFGDFTVDGDLDVGGDITAGNDLIAGRDVVGARFVDGGGGPVMQTYTTGAIDLTATQTIAAFIPARSGYFPVMQSRQWIIHSKAGTMSTSPTVRAGSDAGHVNFIASTNSTPAAATVNAGAGGPFIDAGPSFPTLAAQRFDNTAVAFDVVTGATGTGGFALNAELVVSVFWCRV